MLNRPNNLIIVIVVVVVVVVTDFMIALSVIGSIACTIIHDEHGIGYRLLALIFLMMKPVCSTVEPLEGHTLWETPGRPDAAGD